MAIRNNILYLNNIKIEENYSKLHASGMMWVYFPEFTGNFKDDSLIIDKLIGELQ